MRGFATLLTLILLISSVCTSSAYNLTISVKDLEGEAYLNITSLNFTYEANITSDVSLEVSKGNYAVTLSYKNVTFFKRVDVKNDTTLNFNLAFTNDSDVISVAYHTLIIPSSAFEVHEVFIFENSVEKNYEGDFAIPLPEFRDLKVESSSLSFTDFEVRERKIVFKDLLIGSEGGGQISVSYILKSNIFERKMEKTSRVMIFTKAKIDEKSESLIDMGIQEFGGSKFHVLEGETDYYFVKLEGESRISLSPLALAGIFLVSGSVFLILYERSGRWKF